MVAHIRDHTLVGFLAVDQRVDVRPFVGVITRQGNELVLIFTQQPGVVPVPQFWAGLVRVHHPMPTGRVVRGAHEFGRDHPFPLGLLGRGARGLLSFFFALLALSVGFGRRGGLRQR